MRAHVRRDQQRAFGAWSQRCGSKERLGVSAASPMLVSGGLIRLAAISKP
jgi:hypothetical protein